MSVQDHSGYRERPREGLSAKAKAGLVLVGFPVIAGALLFTEHNAHVLRACHKSWEEVSNLKHKEVAHV